VFAHRRGASSPDARRRQGWRCTSST
jgi:hypothetical protein